MSLTIRSFLRSVMTIRPFLSKWPTSPVASQPSLQYSRRLFVVAPIAEHHVLAADHDLAILGDPHFAILRRRSHRLEPDADARPVAADQRPRLGLAVTLQERDPERLEEDADLRVERRAARHPRLDPATHLRADLAAERQRENAVHRHVPRLQLARHICRRRSSVRDTADIWRSRRSLSIPLMIRARSSSNSRGTTTMIVGCTSSILAASFSRLSA